jgi:hypothetical protein
MRISLTAFYSDHEVASSAKSSGTISSSRFLRAVLPIEHLSTNFFCSPRTDYPKDLQGLLISSINGSHGHKKVSYTIYKIFGIALSGLFTTLLVVCSYYLWLGFQKFRKDLIQARYLTLILLGVQITSIVVTFIQVMLLVSAFAFQMCWKKFASYDNASLVIFQMFGMKFEVSYRDSPFKALKTFKKNYTGNQLQYMRTKSFGSTDAETLRSWITPSDDWIGDYLRFKDIMRVYFYMSLVAILFSIGGFAIFIG